MRVYFIGIVIAMILVFGRISSNGLEYSAYRDKFNEECELKGGVMFVPKGVKSWPVLECRNPEPTISVGTWQQSGQPPGM